MIKKVQIVRDLTKAHNFSIEVDPVIQLGKMEYCRALYACYPVGNLIKN